jgi:hypothetical protein
LTSIGVSDLILFMNQICRLCGEGILLGEVTMPNHFFAGEYFHKLCVDEWLNESFEKEGEDDESDEG